jgi:hypothetical protein
MHRMVPGLALVTLILGGPIMAQDAPPSGKSLSSPQEQRQADESQHTPSGKAGRDEPGAHAKTAPNDPPVLKDGKFNTPTAPTPPQQNE